MTHRKKWMAVTLAALAVSSLAIGLAGLFLLHASLLKTAAEQRDLVQENLSSRLEKQLAYFSGTADFLFGSNEDFIRRCFALDAQLEAGEEPDEPITAEMVQELQMCVLRLNSADPA